VPQPSGRRLWAKPAEMRDAEGDIIEIDADATVGPASARRLSRCIASRTRPSDGLRDHDPWRPLRGPPQRPGGCNPSRVSCQRCRASSPAAHDRLQGTQRDEALHGTSRYLANDAFSFENAARALSARVHLDRPGDLDVIGTGAPILAGGRARAFCTSVSDESDVNARASPDLMQQC
jgi:hypothetical protein